LNFTEVPHIAGVPRYLYRTCLASFVSIFSSRLRGDVVASFEHELWIWFFAGIVKQRWRNRHEPITPRVSALTVTHS
jgi:hypothetical protein